MTFWVLDAIQDNLRPRSINVALGGYANQDAYVAGGDPMEIRSVTLLDMTMRLPLEQVEVAVQATDDWKDASVVATPERT